MMGIAMSIERSVLAVEHAVPERSAERVGVEREQRQRHRQPRD